MELAIAMYIVISLIAYGPDIEKAAETIRERIDERRKRQGGLFRECQTLLHG
jgi:hypothetical protein